MYSQTLVRNILRSSFRIKKIVTIQYSSMHVSRGFGTITNYVPAIVRSHQLTLQRLYSQSEKVNSEAMVVDYDYVKSASSDNNILIVDVREPDEIKEHGKIPNSINIPLGNVTPVLGTMPEKEFQQAYQRTKPLENTEIIFYCMMGKRAGNAQQNAANLGFKNSKTYSGSWTDWKKKDK